jgi:hypothetical protein
VKIANMIIPNLQEEETKVCLKDLQNVLNRCRLEELQGKTPIEWLCDYLGSDHGAGQNFLSRDTREGGNITKLFVVRENGIRHLLEYPDVLLFDCTYKSNRFKMPLLNICGATATRKTFQVAAVFMNGEKQDQYRWALEVLTELYNQHSIEPPKVIITDLDLGLIDALSHAPMLSSIPYILCRWHVNMDVLAKTRVFFPEPTKEGSGRVLRDPEYADFIADWNALVGSTTAAEYESQLAALKQPGRYPELAVSYILNTWIVPWKEKFICYFINRILHYGHSTTSIVEPLHAVMKRYLINYNSDLKTAFLGICQFWHNQDIEMDILKAKQKNRHIAATIRILYSAVRDQITGPALEYLQQEQKKLPRNASEHIPHTQPCSCSIGLTHGLPCMHVIHRKMYAMEPLQMSDINRHWWLNRDFAVSSIVGNRPLLLDPRISRSKGRPQGAIVVAEDNNSTQSLPSAFEVSESIEALEAVQIPSSTARGIHIIEAIGGSHEPGTVMPRIYHETVDGDIDELSASSSDWLTGSPGTSSTAAKTTQDSITVRFEGKMDEILQDLGQEPINLDV